MLSLFRRSSAIWLVLLVAGCATGPNGSTGEAAIEVAECMATETVPAATGTNQAAAEPETDSLPPVEEERTIRFATVCPEALTLELVANLQRALMARDLFDAGVTGTYGEATKAAVMAYQTQFGLPSSTLSLRAARELGLVAYPREETGAGS